MLHPQPKPQSRAAEVKAAAKAAVQAHRSVRQAVRERDGYRCRVCHTREGVDVHHIRFRSLGGPTTTANLALLCMPCHQDVHAYRLAIEGDANGRLRVTRSR